MIIGNCYIVIFILLRYSDLTDVSIEYCSETSINLVLLLRLHFLLHCRCLLYNQFYFICYISFYVACAFVICL